MYNTKCPDCDGDGYVYYDVPRPQSFTRDIGYIDEEKEKCDMCQGSGEVPKLCTQCEEPTDRPTGSICSDCYKENYK